ncbi:TetR/AcrR family transcriptional regulator [Leucobacter chromiireducens]|uniref:TetR/AcrR family transcriptional regulator n=1 Tax=Leucobacter chromiireducens TaxID=283877 RepID=UPI000F6417D6|nr:TetR/AcrR family transcriptional regulator [Leucobacter chromiireducens]
MSIDRPMRADAVRNRRSILDAAQAQISAHGPDVGMEEIAKASGVAVGTLYRHFPTKTDLLAAVIAGYVGAVADDVEASLARARDGASAGDEIVGFLERVVESSAHTHAVKAAARSLGVEGHGDQSDEARAGAALAELITLGQRAGDIRPEVTVDDFYLLMATTPTDQTAEVRRRWLELVLPGITTRA